MRVSDVSNDRTSAVERTEWDMQVWGVWEHDARTGGVTAMDARDVDVDVDVDGRRRRPTTRREISRRRRRRDGGGGHIYRYRY